MEIASLILFENTNYFYVTFCYISSTTLFMYNFRDVLAKNKMLKNKGIYKRLIITISYEYSKKIFDSQMNMNKSLSVEIKKKGSREV